MKNSKSRGIAIISTLLFVGLLFMMALSVILMSRQRSQSGIAQYQQTQALYLAEAALARAQVALESDLTWPGVTDGVIDGLPGSYTIHFDDIGKYGSVNNISKLTAADSYRGIETVPANTALLIVDAQVSGHRYVLEALVRGMGGAGYVTDAILADGKVRAKGDLQVDGITALDDNAPVDGSIQSNLPGSSDLVVWEGGGTALVTGNVGTMGDTTAAVNMPGATIQGGSELSSSAVIPDHDITGEVAANLGHSPPSWNVGGTTTLTGSYTYTPGPTDSVPGDIVLQDGATLYVDGDLTVIGSISGEGTVYVNGKTTFKGDSSVTTNPDFTVSLYSEDNVSLTGFDGTDFLTGLTNPDVMEYLAVAEDAVQRAQTAANAPGAAADNPSTKGEIWLASAALGDHGGFHPTVLGEPRHNILQDLKLELQALPPGPTQTFLADRVEKMELLFGSVHEIAGVEEFVIINEFEATGNTRGLLDAVLTDNRDDYWPQAANLLNSINYDKLGSSYFQGAVYTKGHFYADNEVSILGALIVKGTGGVPENVTLPDGSVIPLSSGDIYLGNRSRVTYVEEMFKDDDSSDPTGPQILARSVWMGR